MKKLFSKEYLGLRILAFVMALLLWAYVCYVDSGHVALPSGLGR